MTAKLLNYPDIPVSGLHLMNDPALLIEANARFDDRALISVDGTSRLIGEVLLKSILLEVSCYPKPGLVTPLSSGSHDDMNLQTFILSSAAISPCFYKCAQLGRNHQGDLASLLRKVRHVGVFYENHLLEVTGQVNTQRGILFSASLLCAAAGYISQQGAIQSYEQLSGVVSDMCQGLCSRDFSQLKYRKAETAGEILYERYGAAGVRGEAESGFSTALKFGLPALENAFSKGLSIRLALAQCLLVLMGECDDTTVLWRAGEHELNVLKNRAKDIVKNGGVMTDRGMRMISELDEHCLRLRISPGGSADLLALSVGFYLLKNKKFSVGVM